MSKAAVRTATALALVILGSLASAQPDDALREEVRRTEIIFDNGCPRCECSTSGK